MSIVVDTSISLAWYFPDESDEVAEAALDYVAEKRAVVPIHWAVEMANGLMMAVRRNRISEQERREAIADLQDLNFVTDQAGLNTLWQSAMGLADLHQLSIYDSMYLETSIRLGLPLATADKALKHAAAAESVAVFETGTP